MEEVVFVLDESGAKGYSNNMESTPGELGVMAGYLIPKIHLNTVLCDLDEIRSKFLSDGKVHITDLSPQQQGDLRSDIFEYFIKRNIYWVYEAIYVQGFFENSDFLNSLTKASHEKRRSDIKISWKEKRDLLHAELFQGAFGKAVAFCIDHVGSEINLSVITDRTDKTIIEKFKCEADDLLSVGEEKTYEVTGFDTTTKKIVKGAISSSITLGAEALGDFSGVSYTIVCEDSALTLAADVLVNSVNYHLKSLQSTNTGASLNTAESINGHALSGLVYGSWNNSEVNYFSDALFMHPTQKAGGST